MPPAKVGRSAKRPRIDGLLVQAALLFALLAFLYTFSVGLRASRSASITGDEPFYLVTTQSLLQDGDLDLRNQYEYETYRSFFDHPDRLWRQAGPLPDGRLLSPHQPGLSILLVPGFVLGGLRGAQLEMALLAALTFTLAFVLAALTTRRHLLAWGGAAIVGLTAPAFVYSTEIYPEVPAALTVVGALLLMRLGPGWARCSGIVLVLTALAWLGLKYVPVGMVIAAFYAWRAGHGERIAFIAAGSVSAASYAWWHIDVFGALTPYSSNLVYDGASTATVLESHLSFSDRVYRLWGLFVDRNFGVGRWAPVLLLIVPALPQLRRASGSGGVIAAVIATQLLMATFAAITMMGWWFPGRMLIVVFPLFVVALVSAAAVAPRSVVAAGGIAAAYSLAVTAMLTVAATNGEVVIAVDPFEMDGWLFRLTAPLFPDYRWWTAEARFLNALWLGAGVGALTAVGAWPYRSPIRRRVQAMRGQFAKPALRSAGWRQPHGD